MDGNVTLDPGYQYQQQLTKKYANLGTLKDQASYNSTCCLRGYGADGKVRKFKCFVCNSECKVSSVKTHLGGEKHHKKWKLLFNPLMDADELTESYSTFCNVPTNKPYISGRYHTAMSKKDPLYAAKRQRASADMSAPDPSCAPTPCSTTQSAPARPTELHSPMHQHHPQSTGAMRTTAGGPMPSQLDPLQNNQNNTDTTTVVSGCPPDLRTPAQQPEIQGSTSRCGTQSSLTARPTDQTIDAGDSGVDDWVEEEPEKQTALTDLPGQSDPANVSRRLAATEYAKNWTSARHAGPGNRRY